MDVSIQWYNKECKFECRSFVDVEELFKDFPRDEAYAFTIDFDRDDRTFVLIEGKRKSLPFYSLYIEGTKSTMITLMEQLLREINDSV